MAHTRKTEVNTSSRYMAPNRTVVREAFYGLLGIVAGVSIGVFMLWVMNGFRPSLARLFG